MHILGWTLIDTWSCQGNFLQLLLILAGCFLSQLWFSLGLALIRLSWTCVHRTLSTRLQTGACRWMWFQTPLLSAGLLPMSCWTLCSSMVFPPSKISSRWLRHLSMSPNIRLDCWRSVFLSKFQQGFSLKENGTKHRRGAREKNRLQTLLMFLRTSTPVKII